MHYRAYSGVKKKKKKHEIHMQTCIIISSDNTNKKKKTRIGAFFFFTISDIWRCVPFSHVSAFFFLSSVCLHMKRREMEKRKIGALLAKKKSRKWNITRRNLTKKKSCWPWNEKTEYGNGSLAVCQWLGKKRNLGRHIGKKKRARKDAPYPSFFF